MKKRFMIFVSLCLFAGLLLAPYSFAEQERVGFVKGSWRKFLNALKEPGEKALSPAPPPAKKAVKPVPQAKPAEPTPAVSPITWLSKYEIRERIKRMLEITPEVIDFIPELKIARDEEDNIIKVEYNLTGAFVNIEAMEKADLMKVHNRINNERMRIHTERIQSQLEATRRATQVAPVPPPQPVTPPPPVPRPPEVPSAFSIPKTPTPLPATPKLPPSPPPSGPRR